MEKELKVMEEREIITTKEDIDKNNPAYFENNENNENENREFYVYKHVRLDNNTCFYVGKGKGNRKDILTRNNHHNNISNRYGHKVVIIKDHLTEEEAFNLETEIIEDYVFTFGYGIDIIGFNNEEDEIGHLTNCTWGGEGISGIQFSEEHKQRMSESMKGKNKGKHHSGEAKRKMSESHKGIQLSEEHKQKISEAMKGIQHSEEAIKKMSESKKGIQRSDEVKRKISEAKKGIQPSEETRKKMSESKKGKNHPLYGKHHSEETKQKISESLKVKMSESNSKKVICITTGKIFNSMKEAGNYYKCSSISLCCEGIYKSAGKLPNGTKLKWKYVKDYNNDFKGILINPIMNKRC